VVFKQVDRRLATSVEMVTLTQRQFVLRLKIHCCFLQLQPQQLVARCSHQSISKEISKTSKICPSHTLSAFVDPRAISSALSRLYALEARGQAAVFSSQKL
jgi:hypothetical protein